MRPPDAKFAVPLPSRLSTVDGVRAGSFVYGLSSVIEMPCGLFNKAHQSRCCRWSQKATVVMWFVSHGLAMLSQAKEDI